MTLPSASARIVFDLGGTWFRSAIYDPARDVTDVARCPAASVESFPDASLAELQQRLLSYLTAEVRRRQSPLVAPLVGISLGAAIDANTGLVVAGSPLWGARSQLDWDIAADLRERMPDISWTIVNDLTAVALGTIPRLQGQGLRRIAVLTVSTGVAMRTAEPDTGVMDFRRDSGLQGEIGHLPARIEFHGEPLSIRCDCGGLDHVSSFASGRGIERLLHLESRRGEQWLSGREPLQTQFLEALELKVPAAQALLDVVTEPLARALLGALASDGGLDRILLTGGVVEALGSHYVESLTGNMARLGLYGSRLHSAEDFREIIRIPGDARDAALRGAGLASLDFEATVDDREVVTSRMESVRRVGYDIRMTRNVFAVENHVLRMSALAASGDRRLVVSESRVWSLYGEQCVAYFSAGHVEVVPVIIEVTEEAKNIESVLTIIQACELHGVLRRREPLVAVGGGVLLDVAALAAGLYRRGIPYLRVPTTLVAMIDAAIGIKSAINYMGRKSLVGLYHPPASVVVDSSFLATLDDRQMRDGLSEALKIALVRDTSLFDRLEKLALDQRLPAALRPDDDVIAMSIEAMRSELAPNLWEDVLERRADLGHSFSPTIEMEALPRLSHGEAVALDIAVSVLISERRGLLAERDGERIFVVLSCLGLPVFDDIVSPDILRRGLEATRKHRDGKTRVPLLTGIGETIFVNDISGEELTAAAQTLRTRAEQKI